MAVTIRDMTVARVKRKELTEEVVSSGRTGHGVKIEQQMFRDELKFT